MKAIKIQARKLLNTCHFYGIAIEENKELNYFIITGDVGFYSLKRLQEVAEDCSMAILLVNSKLTIQYIAGEGYLS